jgi:hypothetical protein
MHHNCNRKAKVTISNAITALALVRQISWRGLYQISVFKRVKMVEVKTAIDVKQWIHETENGKCCL